MLFEAMNRALEEPRVRYSRLVSTPNTIDIILNEGAKEARQVAGQTMDRVMRAMLGKSPNMGLGFNLALNDSVARSLTPFQG